MGSITPTISEEPNPLPYWQVNVPPEQRTSACPPFLQNLSKKDELIINTPDAAYIPLSWPEVQSIVSKNRIHLFQRVPSELRRYLAYNWELKQRYGSVMDFVLKERLGWRLPIEAEGSPFEKESDLKVLWNDWPYGLDRRIVHLVVWTRFVLEDEAESDELTAEARKSIDEYVDRVFAKQVGKENVIWFKNWKSLKSVHAVEHFHVMLFDPDLDFVKEVTHGDVPLSRKV